MKASTIAIMYLFVIIVISMAAIAMIIPANEKAKENAPAPEKSPVIGNEWELNRVDIIHYAKGGSGGGKPKPSPTCYGLLGPKWTALPVNYNINPSNPDGMSEPFVVNAFSSGAESWDDATSQELFAPALIDYSAVWGQLDSQNNLVFGDYPNDRAVAVTRLWYSADNTQIVEFDIIFNTRFHWGDGMLSSTVMDVQNIGTHELGHSVGLADIYDAPCNPVTMYAYTGLGEINKRSLEQPDKDGLQKIYGP